LEILLILLSVIGPNFPLPAAWGGDSMTPAECAQASLQESRSFESPEQIQEREAIITAINLEIRQHRHRRTSALLKWNILRRWGQSEDAPDYGDDGVLKRLLGVEGVNDDVFTVIMGFWDDL